MTAITPYEWAKVRHGAEAVGYVAGMLDGEGCINLYIRQGRKRYVGVMLLIVNKNIESLEFCQKVIGGRIKVHSRANLSKGHCESYRLIISNRRGVTYALQVLYPHLIIKREVAKLVIELIDSLDGHRYGYTPREREIVTEVKELNRRGL